MRGLLQRLFGHRERRLDSLRAQGRLISVDDAIQSGGSLIQTTFYGGEVWLVPDAAFHVEKTTRFVSPGKLLAENGSPRDALKKVRTMGVPVRKVWYRW